MRSSLRPGEPGEVIYGIIRGEVEMWVNGKVVETIKQGDIFGEGALVHEDHQRASTAIAKNDCQLAFLAREHFLFAVQLSSYVCPRSHQKLFRPTSTLSASTVNSTLIRDYPL